MTDPDLTSATRLARALRADDLRKAADRRRMRDIPPEDEIAAPPMTPATTPPNTPSSRQRPLGHLLGRRIWSDRRI